MFRFGVAHRLTSGLLAVTLLTVVAAGLALYGIDRFRDGFDRIAVGRVGDLVAVSRLAQQAQAIAVTAPRLVAAGDRFERDRAMRHLDDLFGQLSRLFEQAEVANRDPASIQAMHRYRHELTQNLKRLDQLVANRHTAEQLFRRQVAALSNTTHDAALLVERLIQGAEPSNQGAGTWFDSDTNRHLQLWLAALNEGSMAAVLAASASAEVVVDRIEAASRAAGTRARAVAALVPDELGLNRIGERIEALTAGPDGVFAARRALLVANRQAQGALNRINVVSGQFVAAASNLFADALADIEADRTEFRALMDGGANALAGLVLVSLLAAGLIFVYLRRRVIGPLVALSRCMRDRADGRPSAIPADGHDELADMAQAFGFFVDEVGRREAELRAAKDEAETALRGLQAAQTHLVSTEKLAALGSLVAGVAHEINTPIGVALTGASFMQDRSSGILILAKDGRLKRSDFDRYLSDVTETCEHVLFNIHRAANLIQSFKQVAADQTSEERRRFGLVAYIRDVVASFEHRLRAARVSMSVEGDEEIEIDSNPGAVAQVISNLIMNALMHGFEGRDGGSITIKMRVEGDQVHLVFADDGVGMNKQVVQRAFEPFFTTKRGRGGTGLGLHIVHNIVQKTLGGRITVESGDGIGTRFTILVPIVSN